MSKKKKNFWISYDKRILYRESNPDLLHGSQVYCPLDHVAINISWCLFWLLKHNKKVKSILQKWVLKLEMLKTITKKYFFVIKIQYQAIWIKEIIYSYPPLVNRTLCSGIRCGSTVEPRSSGIFGHQEFFRYCEDFR